MNTGYRQVQDASGKIRSVDSLLCDLERHRKKNRTIVFTNGCFDVLHRGHVEYLQFCRRQGDVVVVGLNSDNSINIYLDCLPVNGKLQIRDWDEPRRTDDEQRSQPPALPLGERSGTQPF